MFRKIMYFVIASGAGVLCSYLGIPAGWLIGALLTGIIYSLFIEKLQIHPNVFQFALAFIGVNIGLTVQLDIFSVIAAYFIPLLISMVVILVGGWLFGKVLHRYSEIDEKTAFFCCIPGGASVMMALSEEFGADQRIVAAFHSTRIILFVLLIPSVAGLLTSNSGATTETVSTVVTSENKIGPLDVVVFSGIVLLALILAKVFKIAAAPFLYSMLLGFVINQFIVEIGTMPTTVVGFGQVLLGGIIGLRFDRFVFYKLKEIGIISIIIMLLYLLMGFLVAVMFFWLTPLDFVTSMLSVVPAGAPEMASTAALLGLPASVVASMQLVRLLLIILLLPLAIPLFVQKSIRNIS